MFPDLLASLGPGERCVVARAIAGPGVRPDLRALDPRHPELVGSGSRTRAEFHDPAGHREAGRIRPRLARSSSLSGIAGAQAAFAGKRAVVPDAA